MKLNQRLRLPAAAMLLAALLAPAAVLAHGFAGKRFFPATLSVEDPFVADEADVLLGHIGNEDDGGNSTSVSFEYSKRLTEKLGLSFAGTYLHVNPEGRPSANGFDDFEFGAKYLLDVSASAERILSAGLDVEAGGTGSKTVGAEPFSHVAPTLYFGQGLGKLPASLQLLRPLAVTGSVGASFPSRGSESVAVEWGLTVLYDIHYLQSFVKDVGVRAPLDRVIPVVELPMSTCVSGPCKGHTTGTVNPGIMWFSNWGQLGLEAQVPVNRDSGTGAGFLLQFHLYLDDVFPRTLGKPLLD